mgnify:CR=1 FL=1
MALSLELMDVDALAEQLPQRLDQPRMPREQAEGLAESMCRKGGPRRASFLPPDFLAVKFKNALCFRA